ncbi:MAG: gephyrin-like molybdotransferase Glp [Pseudomonadota bacterium]
MSNEPSQLIPAERALEIVLGDAIANGVEHVTLQEANGRVLGEDLASRRTQPPFDASAMDGYAVQQQDLDTLPSSLKIVGHSRAGEPFGGTLKSGEAVRIFTGAVVPEGADSIIIQENTRADESTVTILQGIVPGKFIRKAGLDFMEGEVLLNMGDILTPYRIALAASMDHARLCVVRKPLVSLISTGDELVMPGETTGAGQIIASNTFGLGASIRNTGANLLDLGIVADTREALRDALMEAISKQSDLIVTTGGASVGDHDLVLPVAKELGFEFELTKIAVRPGKPFLYGKLKVDERFIRLAGLAGNPVSSLVAYNVFVKPLIQIMGGKSPETVQMRNAVLGRDMPENDERAEYMRATLTLGKAGELVATAFDKQDSSMLANLVRADCLLYRPVKAAAEKAGQPCQVVIIE